MLVGDAAQLPSVGDFTMELGDDGQQEGHHGLPFRAICDPYANSKISTLTIAGATTFI